MDALNMDSKYSYARYLGIGEEYRVAAYDDKVITRWPLSPFATDW